VFEVAIGGGEPTFHPEAELMLRGELDDMVINFTTRNIEWVCYHAVDLGKYGGFALSVDGQKDVDSAITKLDKAGILTRASLQYVMGCSNDYEFGYIVKRCAEAGVPLTLLGYKDAGRGMAAKKDLPRTPLQKGMGWVDIIKKHHCTLSVDTALAARIPSDVFDELYIRRQDGTHSMYIDAVTQKAGLNSYTDNGLIPIEGHAHGIQQAYEELRARLAP
jgi:hypothetical protein